MFAELLEYTINLSKKILDLRPSPTFAVVDAANKRKAAGKDVVSFSVGEPAEPTPQYVREGLIKLIQDDAQWAKISKYSPVGGLPELKQAIVDKLADENGLEYTHKEILVSNGGKQAIANAFAATINPGDEVLMAEPSWVSYPDMVKFHGGVPVGMLTNNDFKITPETLKITLQEHPKAKWLVLTSPSNPTSSVYSKDELAALAQVILEENTQRKKDKRPLLMVMSDDIYEHMVYMVYNDALVNKPGDPSAISYNIIMAEPKMKPYTLIINGVAKAFGMTGYRIGYAAGPEMLISGMEINNKQISGMADYQGMETSGASAISQAAATIALSRDNKKERDAHFAKQRESYTKRRDLVADLINNAPNTTMSFKPMDGAFYAMIDVTDLANEVGGTGELAKKMINEKGVALVSGDDFYIDPSKQNTKYLRLSFATSEDNLRKGIALMQDLEREILPNGRQAVNGRG